MITPILTEKSMAEAKKGRYTFSVDLGATKREIKKMVNSLFGVGVVTVATLTSKGGSKKNNKGKMQKIRAHKKAIVTLKEKQKIDLFEEQK